MFYPVIVKDPQGNIKQIISPEALMFLHWGADAKCVGCGLLFKTKTRRSRMEAMAAQAHPSKIKFVPDLVPDEKFCGYTCRQDHTAKKRRKVIAKTKPDYVKNCRTCEKPFTTRKGNAIYCGEECRESGMLMRKREYSMEIRRKKALKGKCATI